MNAPLLKTSSCTFDDEAWVGQVTMPPCPVCLLTLMMFQRQLYVIFLQKKQATLERAAASYNQWYIKTEEERIQRIQKNKEIARLKVWYVTDCRKTVLHSY